MSGENKFFRFVWRFNAIAIALAVLGALALIVVGLMKTYPAYDSWNSPKGHFAPVPKAAEAKNTYRLKPSGTVAFLKDGGGQDVYLVYSLGDWQGAPNAYGLAHIVEGSSNRVRDPYNTNLLLVNSATGESRWLFSGYGRDITNWDQVTDPTVKDNTNVEGGGPVVVAPHALYGDLRLVKALVFKVLEKDADHDGELTEKDGVTLYVWHPADAAPVKLLDADLILSQAQIGKDRYVVSYEAEGKAWVAVYSAPDFKLLTKKPLPKLPG